MIQVFRSLPVAHSVHRVDDLPASVSKHRCESVSLGWEERLKVRARRVSDAGFEFATALDRGHVLRAGDCFVFDHPPLVIRVVERPEPVLAIRPQTPREWASFGYHIGNSHQPMMVADSEIVCADVPGMEQILRYHAIPFVREHRAFTPIGQLPHHRHQVTT